MGEGGSDSGGGQEEEEWERRTTLYAHDWPIYLCLMEWRDGTCEGETCLFIWCHAPHLPCLLSIYLIYPYLYLLSLGFVDDGITFPP